MNYLKLSFVANEDLRDLLVASLNEAGFEGFEETDTTLHAFIPEAQYNEELIASLARDLDISFAVEVIAPQNWNETWESNFEPVIVADFCTVRAHFHDMEIKTPYEVVITPKMSFGTGHHATTQLMMKQMQDIDFGGREVFDFGAGTGILSILAEKLGAASVLAVDNDEWCYENGVENAANNNCTRITTLQGSIELATGKVFDIVLANINRHILLMYMQQMHQVLKDGGLLLMSGLLTEDRTIVDEAATAAGFRMKTEDEQNNWIVLRYEKI